MEDVFGGLTGGDGAGSGGGPLDVAALEAALEDAAVWGAELDPRFRVLAVTLEPTADRSPWGGAGDRRVQLLCFPVSTILGSFRRESPEASEVMMFTDEQLVDVVATFDGAPVRGPLFGRPEPRPGAWGPQFSLAGRSSAPDGIGRTLTLSLRHEDLALDLFARFDELELKGPDGEDRSLPG